MTQLISHRTRALTSGLLLASTLGFASGCLLLAKRPKNEIGEECENEKQCPDIGYCAHLEGESEPGICLPDNEECHQVVSPQCEGYACEVDLGYCHRSCESYDGCVEGYTCDFDYKTGEGTCVLGP